MPDGIEGPLTEQDLVELNKRLEDLKTVDKLIDQATRGGIDVADQRKRASEIRDQLARIKQSFFPGR